MEKSTIIVVFVNLLLGNLILYFNKITEFSIAFSISAVLVLIPARILLNGKWLKLKAVVLSLLVTLLVPVVGFWIAIFTQSFEPLSPEVLQGTFLYAHLFGVGALFFAWDKFLVMYFANQLLFLWIALSKVQSTKNSSIHIQ